jgi:hypothetical protein
MAIETDTNEERNNAESWTTDEELREHYPELWRTAKEKVARIKAAWAPEIEEELRKLRER